MEKITSGMPASRLQEVLWRKSRYSNPSGNCVEVAELPDGGIAVRNSRHPSGPVLIYTRTEIADSETVQRLRRPPSSLRCC